jgi:hypothetical protein
MSSWWISVRHIWVAIDPHASLAPGYQSSDTVSRDFAIVSRLDGAGDRMERAS